VALRRPGDDGDRRRRRRRLRAALPRAARRVLRHRRPSGLVSAFEPYTGLPSDDVGFAEAAATIGAQTALSTFVSYAAFLLVLFPEPPNRWFAAWTRPDGDRRPALLVTALVVAFSAGLFWPAFTTYSGLTDAEPVFETVLPALVLWCALLTAAYRLRLPERALGVTGPPWEPAPPPQVHPPRDPGRPRELSLRPGPGARRG
jgi:cation-transporting ATPase E